MVVRREDPPVSPYFRDQPRGRHRSHPGQRLGQRHRLLHRDQMPLDFGVHLGERCLPHVQVRQQLAQEQPVVRLQLPRQRL
ncbi:MAG TPA: hypothetical protein VGS80_13455, partial [Ktedonobacterales bacterium]|nr:hypothetical protein [Ktedonobacterales bacterium]